MVNITHLLVDWSSSIFGETINCGQFDGQDKTKSNAQGSPVFRNDLRIGLKLRIFHNMISHLQRTTVSGTLQIDWK